MEEESSTSIAEKQNMAARAEANLDENIKNNADIAPEEEEEEEETTLEEIKCLLVGVVSKPFMICERKTGKWRLKLPN